MRTITTTLYTIEEHPNPDACLDWIRCNIHDLADFEIEEFTAALDALVIPLACHVDYCVGPVPDRGEHITITGADPEAINDLYEQRDELPLTGTYWDYAVLEAIKAGNPEHALRNLHAQVEHIYSDEALTDTSYVNGWEFTESGEMQ